MPELSLGVRGVVSYKCSFLGLMWKFVKFGCGARDRQASSGMTRSGEDIMNRILKLLKEEVRESFL